MIWSPSKPAMVLLSCVSALGCASAAEGYAEETESEREPSMGAAIYQGCAQVTGSGTNAEALIDAAAEIGRTIVRSSAFQECIVTAATSGLPHYLTGGCLSNTLGPYKPCDAAAPPANDEAWDDPILGETHEHQVTRLLSSTMTPQDVVHDCSSTIIDDNNYAQAGPNPDRAWTEADVIDWNKVSLTPWATAALMWHELGHDQGYTHPDDGENAAACGYPAGTYCVGDHGGTSFPYWCMREVFQQSEASSVCQALACASGEMPLVKRYGRFGGADKCECVPDVFRWPGNENESGDEFGKALAVGNFDGDLYDDLAVGAPGEGSDIGVIYVFRGTGTGLQFWKRISHTSIRYSSYSASPAEIDRQLSLQAGSDFGRALAAGDLVGDGYDDLAVGIPGFSSDAGAVLVMRGSASGLVTSSAELVDQRSHGSAMEPGDRFGAALAVGDLDSDGYDELAVAAPLETSNSLARAGAVCVYRGTNGSRLSTLGGFIVGGAGDELGSAMAIRSVDSDARAELLIGSPGNANGLGLVGVYERLSSSWNRQITLAASGTARFGAAIAGGEVHPNQRAEVIVGAPGENAGAGAVYLFSGTGTQLQRLTDGTDANDGFGTSLAVGHVHSSGNDDLIVGKPGEGFSNGVREGRIVVYQQNGNGSLSAARYRQQSSFWSVSATDSALPTESRDAASFGQAVAIGHFSGPTGFGHYVAGAPGDHAEPGVPSGSIFEFTSDLEDRKRIDQRTMRYGDGPVVDHSVP